MNSIPAGSDINMVGRKADENGCVWYDVTKEPFDLYGFCDREHFLRIPRDVAEAVSPGVAYHGPHTAGGRVRFCTDSQRICIRVKMPYVTKFAHMPLSGTSSFDLYADTDMGSRFCTSFKPSPSITDGFSSYMRFRGEKKLRYITLNFPLYNPVDRLEIGVDEGSVLGHGRKYKPFLPVVFYGSSITQGACASRPGLSYSSIISSRLGLDYVNLGFSGSAKAEDAIVDYMKKLPMSCFVCDYDHNAPDAGYLEKTHLKMYRAIREEQPDLPYIMVSAPNFKYDGDDYIGRRRVIEDSYRYAKDSGDKNVYYIDGDGLFRGSDEDLCTVDALHPNDIGMLKMADSIGRVVETAMRKGFAKREEN